ncbi:helix-turn-helix domain-containing protein [Actinocatenispora sera]|uniref:Transcriptional regulator n=1 Tax=Actinocatenispora sera TaxID=390989 RepID=A0A810KTW3_9ACTN|nr:helix-turn-helix transcriptional regulator [Actinocatenispora sera]BCJ26444.1 transcriptional regulator [Actinocatenispora sera]
MTSVATQTDECGDAAHRLYAAELRRWRQERGVTQERLAALTHYSAALVGMVEKLQRNPTREFTSRCDDVLRTGGALARLLPLLAAESYPSWFRPFVEMEAEATAIQEFEVQVIAGLLQTEDYARAVLNSWPPKSAEEIERRLAARLDRQRILDRADPPLLSFVLDESVLRRPMGPASMMAAQLTHLIETAARPNIQLQILTFEQARDAPTDGAFVVLELPQRERVLYVEGVGNGRLVPDEEIVDRFARAFSAAQCQALSMADSIAFIEMVRRERYGCE